MNLLELEDKYLEYKAAYYEGKEIVSDEDFDKLEEMLRMMGSQIVTRVGAPVRGDRYAHYSKMLSLEKISSEDGLPPTRDFLKWIEKKPHQYFEASAKYDGNAANCLYENGKLVRVLSRGDGEEGLDITSKIIHNIPATIPLKGKVEVRGEIVIDNTLFEEKYMPMNFKNARNYVGGILNREENTDEVLHELTFVAVELKDHGNDTIYHDDSMFKLKDYGFNSTYQPFLMLFHYENFDIIYKKFEQYRHTESKFRLDGLVIKVVERGREDLGENNHHPKWAIAVKFPPKLAVTTLLSVEWKLGKTGELTPVGILEPVDLDGSIVQRVSLYNYGSLVRSKLFPGTKVSIVKAGDIIPKIVNIIEPSPNENYYLSHIDEVVPDKWGEYELIIDGPHLYCKGALGGEEVGIRKLIAGTKIINLDGVGPSICEKLYKAGIKSISDLFIREKFNEATLITSKHFKKGRALDKILDAVTAIKKLDFDQVIHSLQFDKVGSTISRELAKYHSGYDYSFKGLEQEVVERLSNTESSEYIEINKFVKLLESRGIEVKYPEVAPVIDIKPVLLYEMTGSPKPHFKTKGDFTDFMVKKGFAPSDLKEGTAYLVTDSYTSTSSKMVKATKLGIPIITYEDLLSKY